MNKTKASSLTTLLLLAVTFLALGQEKKYETIINIFESELPKIMKQENVHGVAIALTDTKNTIWSKTIGYTDDTKQMPITPNTNFSIQSATKAFTSIAVLLNAQQGKININDPVSKYIDDFSVKSIWDSSSENIITIKNLLNHTSGLTHETSAGNNYDLGDASFSEHVKSISDTWLQYPTGQRQHYSNLGISLAGKILQTVSKKPYTESMKDLVLKPIGMDSSYFISEKHRLDKCSAKGFSNHFDTVPFTPEGGIAAGGLYSNINDMSKFARFILNAGNVNGNVILDAEYFKLLTKLPFQEKGQIQGFGLGLEVKNFNGYEIYMMPGRGFGYMGGIVYFPEEKIALIVLTNNEDTNIPMFAVSNLMQHLVQQNTHITTSNFKLPENTPKAPLNLVEDFKGEYLNDYSASFVLHIEDNKASILINSEKMKADIIVYDGELYAKTTSSLFHFIHDKKNKMKYVLDVYDSEVFYDFNSSKNKEKFNPKWNRFNGNYYLKKWGLSYENIKIHVKNGNLYLNTKRLSEIQKDIFMDCNGNVLDFSKKIPTYKNIHLHRNL